MAVDWKKFLTVPEKSIISLFDKRRNALHQELDEIRVEYEKLRNRGFLRGKRGNAKKTKK